MFLATVNGGRTISKYRKDQIIFSQGNPADAVFYIQKGKVKITVVSEQARKQWSQSWGRTNFAVKDASPGSRGAWRQPLQ